MAEQLREHAQGLVSEVLVDEGFLPGQRFGRAARWLIVILSAWCGDFWEKLLHRRQALLLLLIYPVLGLPKDKLAVGGVVAEVKPVQNSGMQRPFVDGTPSFARINTPNYEIDVCAFGDLLYLCLHALPVQAPEEVDPVC